MPELTQANRPMRMDTVLGPDVLLLTGFEGQDGISQTYSFQLEMLSENSAIDPSAVLRADALITLELPDRSERLIHGMVSRFTQLGQRDRLTLYRAELVPWLWFLNLSADSRIFQNLSVLEIIEQVFQSRGYSDFEFHCNREYEPREYCVQYRETDFNFVSRLMEDEGLFYFFEHSNASHLLVITDNNDAMGPCAGAEN